MPALRRAIPESMNEDLYSAGWHQLCSTLLAIKKQQAFHGYASFDAYVVKRWGISKSRGALFVKFAQFTNMAREARMRIPDVPDNLEPLLKLPQKLWLDAWRYCMDMDARSKFEIEATLDRFGLVRNKRQTQQEKDRRAAKSAGDNLIKIQDINSIKNPGKAWSEGDILRRAAILSERSQ